MRDLRITEIEGLLTLKAEGQYGLAAINQRQHALQAALLAERMGLPAAEITAALLQDRKLKQKIIEKFGKKS